MDQLTKNYFRVLLNAFLNHYRGWNVYITKADEIVRMTGVNADVAKKVYDAIPRQYGFEDNEQLPWALKLENATMDYRFLIKRAAEERFFK